MEIMESLAWNNYIQIFAWKGRNGGMVYVAVNFSYRLPHAFYRKDKNVKEWFLFAYS